MLPALASLARTAPGAYRFAGSALKTLYPGLSQGSRILSRESLGAAGADIGIDIGANVLFGGLTGAMLPGADPATGFEGAGMADRVGASLFDAGTSIPVGMLGRLGGAGVARAARGFRGGRPLGANAEMAIQQFAGMGAEAGLWGSGMVTNPFVAGVVDRQNQAYSRAEEENKRALRDQIIAQERERARREQEALMTGGGFGATLYGLGGLG